METKTNMKLYRILLSLTTRLEDLSRQAWQLSNHPDDTCGAIGIAGKMETDEDLIKQIEDRARQIEERIRRIAALNGGDEGHRRACEFRADELYQKYCGKRV